MNFFRTWPAGRTFATGGFVALLFFCLDLSQAGAQTPLPGLPAFPGAVGFGAAATGGTTLDSQGRHSGGTVYHVTNLNDAGPGSFRDAVSRSGRIVVFDVGGWVHLRGNVHVASNITIAGQTAPGDGIGFVGHGIGLDDSTNVIVRHIRVRVGDRGPGYRKTLNGIGMHKSHKIILDHVSVAFGSWNNIDSVGATDITLQNLLLTDPIGQQFNDHFENGPATFFGNLWCNAHGRQPLCRGSCQYVDNVVYNFGYAFAAHSAPRNSSWDILNNYFICGPRSNPRDVYFQVAPNCNAYASGNLLDSSKNGTLQGVPCNTVGAAKSLPAPFYPSTALLPAIPAQDAFVRTVSTAGAFPRDSVDNQTLDDVRSLGQSGKLYKSQTETGLPNGGYGVLKGDTLPVDADHDGLPDDWKRAKGLDPNNPAIAGLPAPSGYTNLEEYLNWKAQPNAYIGRNTAQQPSWADFDLSKYAAGFIGTPTYTISNVTGGSVTQSGPGGCLAHFVPTPDRPGIAGFTYSVSNGAFTLTGTVGILVSAEVLQKN
jgi:hypothetical protein